MFKTKKIIFVILVSILLIFLNYREFLILYRSMLLDDFFAYYHYQNQIIYYETGDVSFKDYLPMNIRFLGLYIQYLIFKIFPCLQLTNITTVDGKHELFVCATFSLALMNHIFKYLFVLLFFFYARIKLKKTIVESFIVFVLASYLIHYVENYTFDRLTLFFTLLILYFDDHKYASKILLLFSFLINEKIIMVLGPYYFLKFIFEDRKYFQYVVVGLLNVIFYFVMIKLLQISYNFESSPVYNGADFTRIFLNIFDKSHISNSIIPILFCLIPYIIYFVNKKKHNLSFNIFEILIIFLMWLLAFGGGENNVGRYVMHTLPLWLPLFSMQLIDFYNSFISKKFYRDKN